MQIPGASPRPSETTLQNQQSVLKQALPEPILTYTVVVRTSGLLCIEIIFLCF